jgi:serine/threonine protein kinase
MAASKGSRDGQPPRAPGTLWVPASSREPSTFSTPIQLPWTPPLACWTALPIVSNACSGGVAWPIVLEATHGTLGTTVAVKVLHAELGQRQDLVERARIEAQVLARLSHPHIVSVSDFGVNLAGQPYMVMERLVGSPLDQEQKRRGPLPPEETP